MDMKPVESSNIAAIGYDPAQKTLRIQFSTGGLYDYANVPAEEHQKFLDADSFGKHFGKHISGKYPHTKLPADVLGKLR